MGCFQDLWLYSKPDLGAGRRGRYFCYYLLAGTAASLVTALARPHEIIPGIGASGAIFGVVGAYFVLFPGGHIRTLWFISFIPTWPKIRAFWFVLYYLAIQIPPQWIPTSTTHSMESVIGLTSADSLPAFSFHSLRGLRLLRAA